MMYVLINTEGSVLGKLLLYLKRLGLWYKEFKEPEYRLNFTAEERAFASRRMDTDLNPPAAWKTCKHLKQIWDWDSMGRGPDPASDYDIRQGRHGNAPHGKGWIKHPHTKQRVRVAGDCANPTMLSYISCPRSCRFYEPIGLEPTLYILNQTIAGHKQRIADLERYAAFLREADKLYELAVEKGAVFDFVAGKLKVFTRRDQRNDSED